MVSVYRPSLKFFSKTSLVEAAAAEDEAGSRWVEGWLGGLVDVLGFGVASPNSDGRKLAFWAAGAA